MVTPIFRLGYLPATFFLPPPTRRAGGEERIRSRSSLVSCLKPRLRHQLWYRCSSSIPCLSDGSSVQNILPQKCFLQDYASKRHFVQTYASSFSHRGARRRPLSGAFAANLCFQQCKPLGEVTQFPSSY